MKEESPGLPLFTTGPFIEGAELPRTITLALRVSSDARDTDFHD